MDAIEAMGRGTGADGRPLAGQAGEDGTDAGRVLVMRLLIPIRWGDMDAMGHVNNAVYFRYLEQVRISWFERIGLSVNPAGEGPLIVNAHCTFQRELSYPGTVLASQWVGDLGRSSWQTWITLARAEDPGTVCAHGGAKCVWVDFPRKRSAPLPEHARAAIVAPFDPDGPTPTL